ncbi:MAG: cysteine desulfurase family protein [bacterium]|nr:cysteine desulfurase family protein [bacterium]
MQEKRIVYLDHAAATPMDQKVKSAMEPYFCDIYGNPSASYAIGRRAKEALDLARDSVAQSLECSAAEIIFTGSGTESDNLAIFGVTRGYGKGSVIPAKAGIQQLSGSPIGVGDDKRECGHIITTNFEHHAVLNSCEALTKEGYDVSFLKVDKDGLLTPEQLKEAIRPDTLLISIMYANNEIGTIEPIAKLARAIAEKKKEMGRKPNDPPFFHTDACQAAGYLDINVKNLGVDLMTINGSKIYGPKGTGALFVRRGLRLTPLIYGGGQEMKLRSGTENVAAVVGLAKALEEAARVREYESTRLEKLRDALVMGIMDRIPKVSFNGHPTMRLPNNVNVSILDIEGEAMLLYLDESGICASTGSACDFQTTDPSHVIQALGKSRNIARSSVRFTLGRSTTIADIDYVLETLPPIVQKLRKLSFRL